MACFEVKKNDLINMVGSYVYYVCATPGRLGFFKPFRFFFKNIVVK